MHLRVLLAAALLSLAGCIGPSHPPPRDQHGALISTTSSAKDREALGADVRRALTEDLSKFPDLERAYLLTHPNGELFMLVPIFDGAPNNAALNQATETFARVAPDSPPLQLLLLAKATWEAEMSGREPFYVRP